MSEIKSIDLPIVQIPKIEFGQTRYSSGAAIAGFASSALAMSTYKRGLTPTSTTTFSRNGVDSIVDSLMLPTGQTAQLPRRNHRRRDLKYILPKEGFYDRTGFNSPVQIQNYQTQNFFILGLIPSSMQFVPIPDYKNIPAIYDKCEDLSSSSVYSGLAVSNTFPIRRFNK